MTATSDVKAEGNGIPRRRGSREATIDRILDAAEELFSTQAFGSVSVRDIGARAGVTHALVHRYLGSKDEVHRAVLRRSEHRMLEATGGTDDLGLALSRMLRAALADQRQYYRLVTHSALHGVPYDISTARFDGLERLIELALKSASERTGEGPSEADLRFAVASLVALTVGWVALEPWLKPAAGLQDQGDEAVAQALDRILREIVEREVPGALLQG